MDIISATDAMLTRLRTQWLADTAAVAGAVPVLVYEATEKDLKPHPRETTLPWARVTVRHATGRPAAIGRRRYRRTGQVYVQVYVPFVYGTAYTVAQGLAAVAQKAYEGQSAEGVSFTSVAVIERGNEGSFYRADCTASFWWDEIRSS